jgi:uncharacterized protein (TIGR02722 family)
MKSPTFIIITTLIAALGLTGCASRGAVTYEDPGTTQSLTLGFDLPDVNYVSDTMVDSMLTSPSLYNLNQNGERPILIVDRIQNRTDQHVDTMSITDSIRTRLIRSGKFRFTDKQTRDSQVEELEFQNYGPLVDKEKAIQMGKQYGARYMVTGALVSYNSASTKQRVKSYKLTMNLIDLQTGIIEWADEQPIVKAQRRN